MARVRERRRAVSVGAGAARHRQAQAGPPKKPSYKVVLEEVSEQRKLKTLLSFNAEAPAGFTFIPAGDPQLTNRCKQLARDDGSTVYIVSMSDPKHPELSHEVHRVGYHFSSRVVEDACTSLGVTLTESGRVLQSSFATLNEEFPARHGKKPKNKAKGKGRASPPKFDLSQSQATIDTQAREAIKDLFPKIPEADLHETVARSFQKGRDLVGTSSDLSLARRAHLAVLAHIRHTHTNYDNILKLVPWGEARKRVEGPTLDILISWRDDVDDDTNIMRDVLREVIIISDNEDEDDDLAKVDATPKGERELREKSVEIISANSNVHTRRLDLAREPSELENEQRVQYVRRTSPPSSGRPLDRLREERQGAQRHQRWEEAVSRRKEGISSSNLYPRAAQLISEPIYRTSVVQSDLEPPSRILQMPVPASLHQLQNDQRIMQYDGSHRRLPQERVESRLQQTTYPVKDSVSSSIVPIRQIRHSSEQRSTATLNSKYYQKLHHPTEPLGHRYTSPDDSQQFRQAPFELSTERKRFVETHQSEAPREIQYTNTSHSSTTNDERRHRRHQSERILPSVEKDEYDARATGHIVREDTLHIEPPQYQSSLHDRQQYILESTGKVHNHNNNLNLKRAHDDQEVYIVEERPRRPPQFEGRDHLFHTSVNGHPPREPTHQNTEQNFDKAPVVVQYNSRVAQLPPRAGEEMPNAERQRQVYSVPRSRPDGLDRSLHFGPEHDHVVPRDVRRASYAQPMEQHVLRTEPHRAFGTSSLYPTSLRSFTTVEPSVSRIVRIDDVGETHHPLLTDGSPRRIHLYDERGRLVEDELMLRREKTIYMSPR